jgi:hypothetical protein
MWLYGSGFPKSHNIGKAVDKIEGNEREVVEVSKRGMSATAMKPDKGWNANSMGPEIEITKGQSPYEGWGTAMKPAQEIITVAQKPEDLEGTALNLIYIIKKEIWKLYVNVVEQSSELNQVEQKEALDTAQCLVEKNTNIQDALQGLMDMSQLRLMENMNWNIVLLWHTILEDLLQKMSRYTTSTKSNLIIDLKTLKSLEWQNILENITQAKNNQTDGLNVNALTAVVLFNALNLKLKDIQQHSVEDNVIYKEDKMDCLNEPICVARKPLSEKSVAENVLRWGTGGINIDGCRVGTELISHGTSKADIRGGSLDGSISGSRPRLQVEEHITEGRFPANIILDEIAGELLDQQSGIIKGGKNMEPFMNEAHNDIKMNSSKVINRKGYEDKGGASRFFYQAKVSKAERNMGLEPVEVFSGRPRREDGSVIYKETDPEEWKEAMSKLPRKDKTALAGSEEKLQTQSTSVKNTHPTVKPVSLMAYLCRLVTPANGIVLDPFMGSGSTGIAARLEGFKFCGMEMDKDYFKIAESRIENFEEYRKFIK